MFWIRFALESGQVMGLMILASGLLGRTVVLRRDLTVREAQAVRLLDLLAWFGAAIVAVAHSAIALSDAGMGTWFYLANRLEWAEVALFAALVGLQTPAILIFRGWQRYLVRDQIPWYTDRHHDTLLWVGRLQVVLAMALPVLPPLIHQGIGLPR